MKYLTTRADDFRLAIHLKLARTFIRASKVDPGDSLLDWRRLRQYSPNI